MTFCILYHSSKVIDLYAISKRLGNSHMTITGKNYAYILDEYKTRQMIISKKLSIAYKDVRQL